MDACVHDKCYDSVVLTSYPPQRRWVCRICLARGTDTLPAIRDDDEYKRLLAKAKAKDV